VVFDLNFRPKKIAGIGAILAFALFACGLFHNQVKQAADIVLWAIFLFLYWGGGMAIVVTAFSLGVVKFVELTELKR
jgi:hypothetical protein